LAYRSAVPPAGGKAVFAALDETIRQLLIRQVPLDPSEIEISFDTPDREWSGRLTRPTINCFLYDVRENIKLKAIGWEVGRDKANNTATRKRQPLRIDATYQVTTWARAHEDEHLLLWRVLAALARFSALPEDLLQGDLKDQPMPIPASVAQPDQMPANYADLWQALDNRIRPVLTYVLTLVLDPEIAVTRPLTLTAPRVRVHNVDRRDMADQLLVRGRVRDSKDAARLIKGAMVLLQETGDRVLTDEDGHFAFPNAPRGPITLLVRAEGHAEVAKAVTVPAPSYDLEI
jgi:hypothetical protein